MSKKNIKINLGTLNNDELKKIVNLLSIVFPRQNHINFKYLDWLYRKNPEGKAITYNAAINNQIIAHYALIPVTYNLFDEEVKGCLSINTAVTDGYRKIGLFTNLATKAYKKAIEKGYEYIFAISNSASTPGFIKKLNFQLVGSLDVYFKHNLQLSYNTVKYNNSLHKEYHFYNHWNDNTFIWRITRPGSKYNYYNDIPYSLYSKTNLYGLNVCLFEFLSNDKKIKTLKDLNIPELKNLFPLYMWIGLNKNNIKNVLYLPKYFRPSPLNLIFKDLTNKNRVLEKNKVKISILDFDAY